MPGYYGQDYHPDRSDPDYTQIHTRWVLMAKLIADMVYDPQLSATIKEGLQGQNHEEIRRRLVDDYSLLSDAFRDPGVSLDYDQPFCKAFWDDLREVFKNTPLDGVITESVFWAK